MLFVSAVLLSSAALFAFLFNPALGVALLFVAKPVVDANWGTALFMGMPLTQLVAGAVPCFVLAQLALTKPHASLSRMPLMGLWALYAGYQSTMVWVTLGQQDWMLGANVALRTLNGFAGFYMVQAFCHEERERRRWLLALVLAGLFPVGVGLYQAATGVVWRTEYQDVEGLLRYTGLYHDVIMVRHYTFQTILALLLLAALNPRASWPARSGMVLYLAAATLVMLKAYSKAGLVTLALWGLCWTLLQRKLWTLVLLSAIGAVLAVSVASDLSGNIVTIFQKELGFLGGSVEADRTLNGRWYIWQDMLSEWAKLDAISRLFGSGKVGLGAHNDYLQVLFHGGVVGLALYATLLGAIGWRVLSDLWRRVDPLAVAALLAYLSWMVDTIGLVPSAYSGYQWFVWGIIGLSLRVRQDERRRVTPVGRPAPVSETAMPSGVIPGLGGERRFPLVSG